MYLYRYIEYDRRLSRNSELKGVSKAFSSEIGYFEDELLLLEKEALEIFDMIETFGDRSKVEKYKEDLSVLQKEINELTNRMDSLKGRMIA